MLVVIPVLRSDLRVTCIFGKLRWSGLLYCSWQQQLIAQWPSKIWCFTFCNCKQYCHVTCSRTGLSSDGRTSLSFQGTRCNFRGFYVFIYKVYLLLSRSLPRRSEKTSTVTFISVIVVVFGKMSWLLLLYCFLQHQPCSTPSHDHQQHGYNNNISYVWYNFIVRACLIIQFRK